MELHSHVAGVSVVGGNEDAVICLHIPHNVFEVLIVTVVSLL